MRLDTKKQDVVVNGGFEQGGFKVAANANMISILSDKLYSDKILAVVREIVCNAMVSQSRSS